MQKKKIQESGQIKKIYNIALTIMSNWKTFKGTAYFYDYT